MRDDVNDLDDLSVVDAKTALTVALRNKYCKRGTNRADDCPLVLAALDQHKDLERFEVHRSVAHGKFRGEDHINRWRCPSRFIQEYDRIYKLIKKGKMRLSEEGVTFTFKPFHRTGTLAYLRSDKGAARRRTSRNNSSGKSKRNDYRMSEATTMAGVRNRFGRRPRKR